MSEKQFVKQNICSIIKINNLKVFLRSNNKYFRRECRATDSH
jgi:hypothetical protein